MTEAIRVLRGDDFFAARTSDNELVMRVTDGRSLNTPGDVLRANMALDQALAHSDIVEPPIFGFDTVANSRLFFGTGNERRIADGSAAGLAFIGLAVAVGEGHVVNPDLPLVHSASIEA